MDEDKSKYAGYWIRRFLEEYLVTVRNFSINTRDSYRDMFRLMLPHISEKANTSIDLLLIQDMTPHRIQSFLSGVEEIRNCCVKTRNLRLSAIYAFAKYVALDCPEHVEWCRNVHKIPLKKSGQSLITYLEKEEMDAFLEAPDRNTKQGWRDYILMLFLYNTGARADEVASLTVNDILIPTSKNKEMAMVTIKGKGSKMRRCPLWNKTAEELKILIRNREMSDALFLNRLGQPITRFGIYEMVTRYAKVVEQRLPSIKNKRVSPHTIRHTTATHLLQAGVDINTIRAWLGHESINTTNIYAEVNMKMKVEALKCCEIVEEKPEKRIPWKNDEKLMDFLDNLK